MLEKTKMFILKLFFSPLWIGISAVCILAYILNQIAYSIREAEPFELETHVLYRIFNYWRL